MVRLSYNDWLTLAGISLDALEQMMDLFDEAGLSITEMRTLGQALIHLDFILPVAGTGDVVAKMPRWSDFLKSNQIEDEERLKLLGELIVELANHEDGKIDG